MSAVVWLTVVGALLALAALVYFDPANRTARRAARRFRRGSRHLTEQRVRELVREEIADSVRREVYVDGEALVATIRRSQRRRGE